MKRRLYIYQKDMNQEIAEIFSSFGNNIIVENIEINYITILDNDFYNPEPIDIFAFQDLIQDDFGRELSIFIEPYSETDFPLGQLYKEFLAEIPHGVYQFEEVITYVVLKNKLALKEKTIEYIHQCVNPEVIHTVREFIDNNMNSSVSAKKLFMHRNTLNYRIDNFLHSTGINIKTFKGANAIYMLFNF